MKQYLTLTFYILLLALLTTCGSNPNTSSDSGALSFNIKLARPATAYLSSYLQASYLTGNDICIDYGVATVSATVTDSSGKTVRSGSWPCALHQGFITGIPSGTNYTVKLQGKDSNSTVTWSGEKAGLSISRGEITAVGTIAMTYVGSDTTAPTITSTNPSGSAVNVPVTTLLTATFSEKMAISSVNFKTFTLTNGTTPVSGSVTYDSNTKKAIFIPATNLTYSTRYIATITTGVEDMAGNNMQADHAWSFTTEDSPTTAPSAPTGVIATAGNGQVTLTWDAVAGATSYNIYWSTTAGVTKGTGTKISGVTSPYIHTGRNNGTTYYYVVTAVNEYGESNTSDEVSVIPAATDTTPPTGSVIINNNATYTNSTTVTLTLSATDSSGVSQMCISNNNTCPASSWETYTTSKSWILTAGDGTKSVYAWFKDGAGNVSSSSYADSITLDTTAPAYGTLSVTNGDGQVLLSWRSYSDATSGIGSYKLVYNTISAPSSCSTDTEIYSGIDTTYTHNGLFNNTNYYYGLCALDNAGNVSDVITEIAIPQEVSTTPVILVSGLDSPDAIALDSINVYFTDGSLGTLRTVNKSGGGEATLASGLNSPAKIAIDSTSVYIVERRSIKKVRLDNGVAVDIAQGFSYLYGIAVDSANVYFVDSEGQTINKVGRTGGTVIPLVSGLHFPHDIAVDSTSIYFGEINGGTIKKIPINGGPVTTLASGLNGAIVITIDSENVYFTTGDSVKKVGINGGNVITLASGLNNPSGIAIDSTYVYVTEYDGTTLKKVSKDGGTVTILASGLSKSIGIAVDNTNVYFTEIIPGNPSGGTIKKVFKGF